MPWPGIYPYEILVLWRKPSFLYMCLQILYGPLFYLSRKGAGSIPDGVIGIFHFHNPSGRTMVLGSTQPLTEMSTRNISWGQRQPVRRVDNLITFMCWLCGNLGASNSWNPLDLSRPVMGLLDLYLYFISQLSFVTFRCYCFPRLGCRPSIH